MENWDQRNKVTSNSQCPCQFSSVSRHGQTLLFCSAFLTCSCNVSFWEMTSANCFCLSNSFSGLDSFLFTIWSSSSQFWHCLLHTWERHYMTLHGDVSGLNVEITMYEFSTYKFRRVYLRSSTSTWSSTASNLDAARLDSAFCRCSLSSIMSTSASSQRPWNTSIRLRTASNPTSSFKFWVK